MAKQAHFKRSITTAGFLLAVVAAGVPAHAQVFTWDGGGANNNWSTAANWNPNGAPPSAGHGGVRIVFAGTTRLTPNQNLGNPFVLNQLMFDASAGGFTLGGSQIRFAGFSQTPTLTQDTGSAIVVNTPLAIDTDVDLDGAGTGNLSLRGNLTGTHNLILTRPGTTILGAPGGDNGGYVGDIFVNAGTLRLGGGNDVSNTTTVFVANAATFDLNNTGESIGPLAGSGNVTLGTGALDVNVAFNDPVTTFSGVISGTGSVTNSGLGIWYLTGDNTYTGGTTVAGGFLVIGNNTPSGGIVGNVVNNAFLGFERSDAYAFGGVISGTGRVGKGRFGTLTLSGTNTYSGGTEVDAGTLRIAADANLGAPSGDLIMIGGAVEFLAGFGLSAGRALSFPGSTPTLNTGGFNVAVNGPLVNGGGFAKTGSGTLTLLGDGGAMTGPVNVNAGTLAIGSGNHLSNTSTVTVASGATLDLSGGDEDFGGLAGAGSVALGASLATTGLNNQDTEFSGVISGAFGSGALTKGGTGNLTLSGASANTFTGNAMIDSGTLTCNKSPGMPITAGSVFLNGGTLHLAAANQFASDRRLEQNSGRLQVDAPQTLFSFNYFGGSISGISPANPFTLMAGDPFAALVISHGVTSNGFGFNFTNPTGGSIFLNEFGSNTSNFDGGVWDLGGVQRTIGITSGLVNFGDRIQNGGVLKTSPGVLALTGSTPNTYTGMTTVDVGTLTASKTAGVTAIPGDITVNAGTLHLATANQLAHDTDIVQNGGLFQTDAPQTFGSFTYLAGAIAGSGYTLTSSGTALSFVGVPTGPFIGFQLSFTGPSGGKALLNSDGAGPTTFTGGSWDLGGVTREIEVVANTLNLGDVLSNGGLTKTGPGTLVLNANNTYTGPTHVNQGTLSLGPGDALSDATTVTVAAGAQMRLNANDERFGALAGAGSVVLGLAGSPSAMTVGANDASTTFTGTVSGIGLVTKIGTGTWTLTGSNTYVSSTFVSGGTLLVNNTSGSGTGSSSVIVANGATLGGTGTVGSVGNFTLTVQNGGTIAPGASVGTLTARRVTLAAGSRLKMELGTGGSDLLRITGGGTAPAFSATGPITLDVFDAGGLALGQTYPLIDFTGASTGGGVTADDFVLSAIPAGLTGTFSIVGTTLRFATTAAPTLLGDLNCDGLVNATDAVPFVLALTDPDAYLASYPRCGISHGDLSSDGHVDGGDVQAFVNLMFP